MASGKITVANNTSIPIMFSVTENGQPQGMPVASGTLVPNQPSGFLVSGYALYQVNLFAPSGGIFPGPSVTPDSQVEFMVTSDPD